MNSNFVENRQTQLQALGPIFLVHVSYTCKLRFVVSNNGSMLFTCYLFVSHKVKSVGCELWLSLSE
jgi:hypothetical protein